MNKHNYMYSTYTGVHYMALLYVAQLCSFKHLLEFLHQLQGRQAGKRATESQCIAIIVETLILPQLPTPQSTDKPPVSLGKVNE